mgnify:CR=1 FL=1
MPDLAPVTCPACERLRDGVPAHTIELTGDLPRHWNDVRRLLGEVERTVVAAWPLERLFPVRVLDDRVVVATTGMRPTSSGMRPKFLTSCGLTYCRRLSLSISSVCLLL